MVRRIITKVNDIQGTLRVDSYLTGFSESFIQSPNNFITPVAATNVPVVNQSDLYVKYPRGYFWRDLAEVRPLGGRPPQVGYKVESATYHAEEWALEHTVDDRQRANTQDPIRLDENATNLLTQIQLIRADRIWAQKFWTTGVWSQDIVLPVKWDAANSTPIQDLDEWREVMAQQTAMQPNTLILGANVKKTLRNHADVIDRIKYTQIGVAEEDLLARLFNVENVRVARSIYNTAQEGGNDEFRHIVDPDSAWLGYIAPSGGLDTPTAIARWAWTGLIPGAMNQYGGVMTRGRDDRAYTDWFHNRTAFDMTVVSRDLGIFFVDVVGALSN